MQQTPNLEANAMKPETLTPGSRRMIAQSIQIYNSMRPHLSLKYKTPDAVHQASICYIQHFKNAAACSS
jgi:transposase InsO family protein